MSAPDCCGGVASREKVRIAFVSTHHGVGASEDLWLAAAERFAREGHTVQARAGWYEPGHERSRGLRAAGVQPGFLRWGLHGAAGRLARRVIPMTGLELWRFRRSLSRFRPQLVSFSHGNDFAVGAWCEQAMGLSLPFTVVMHGVAGWDWPPDAEMDRWRKVLLAARRTFWVSRRNQEDMERQIGCHLSNARVIWNPVRWPRDTTIPWPGAGESGLRMACVSRLQVRPKGQELLLQALSSPAWRERDWGLTFFGEGENQRALERLAGFLGLQSKVRFAGHVSDLQEVWRNHQVLIQPSRNEGMPMSLIEALMAGRPAVVTDVAGHAEVVTDGVNGFIADAPTSGALNQALERLWNHRGQLPEMGRTAARRIREQVPADPVGEYVGHLKEAVHEGAPGAGPPHGE